MNTISTTVHPSLTSRNDNIEDSNIIQTNLQVSTNIIDLNGTCSICEELLIGKMITILPCLTPHIYHTICIMKWFDKQPICPLCRNNIIEVSEYAYIRNYISSFDTSTTLISYRIIIIVLLLMILILYLSITIT